MDPLLYAISVLSERCMQFQLQNQTMVQRITELEAALKEAQSVDGDVSHSEVA